MMEFPGSYNSSPCCCRLADWACHKAIIGLEWSGDKTVVITLFAADGEERFCFLFSSFQDVKERKGNKATGRKRPRS